MKTPLNSGALLRSSGARDELLPFSARSAKHPLLIQALAGEVKRYRKHLAISTNGERQIRNSIRTSFLELKDAMAHVLEFALRGMDDKGAKGLANNRSFRMPTSYDTLAAVLIGDG